MTATHRLQLSLLIIPYVIFTLTINNANTLQHVDTKISQRILIGPTDVHAYAGDTIQLPCVVSRQPDAVVTWCWNDFCTLGRIQLLRQEKHPDGPISIYQYAAYPRFQLHINERLNHYNLSIVRVSNKDEGTFQCQVQRTMQAHEARSERVQLILIAPPIGQPTLLLPTMPLKQGLKVNITCLSAPSKPASRLILFKNENILLQDDSSITSYEMDLLTKKNLTKIVYTIKDPDSSWDNVIVRCEQMYQYSNDFQKDVTRRIYTLHKPKARIESQNRYPLIVNATATFRCIVQGNPEPQFRWFANAMDLTSLTSSVINIPLSRNVHNHSIGCAATNSIGTTNTSIRLLIRYPPIFLARPPKFVVVDPQTKSKAPTVIRCIVDSFPRARISWHRNGRMIGEGNLLNLDHISKSDEQGLYSYRVETDGFETIQEEFIVHLKGKPLISIQEFKQNKILSNEREFHCQVYSSSPILKINWKLNDQIIESDEQSSISTTCDEYSCTSTLVYNDGKILPSNNNLNRLSCIGENEFGTEQSRLYQIDSTDDPSTILLPIVFSIFFLIVVLSAAAIYCSCRAKQRRKRSMKKLPVVYDAHYSINELIKDVGCLRTSDLRTCNTSLNDNDQLSVKVDQNRLESSDHLLNSLFNQSSNTRKLIDNVSNQSSTNSSGFHSKSTTTFNNEYSPRLAELADYSFSGISPLYASQYQMNV